MLTKARLICKKKKHILVASCYIKCKLFMIISSKGTKATLQSQSNKILNFKRIYFLVTCFSLLYLCSTFLWYKQPSTISDLQLRMLHHHLGLSLQLSLFHFTFFGVAVSARIQGFLMHCSDVLFEGSLQVHFFLFREGAFPQYFVQDSIWATKLPGS